MFAPLAMEVQSLLDFPELAEVEETGQTFEANARLKAEQIAQELNCIALADDSGLVVPALNGEPGIYSARYLGEDTPYSVKNADIIRRLEGKEIPERSARFVCAIAAVLPDGTVLTTEGTIEGYIGYEIRGENGFGYDPIFMVPEFDKTTAELSIEEKNKISHRAKALMAMKEELLHNA